MTGEPTRKEEKSLAARHARREPAVGRSTDGPPNGSVESGTRLPFGRRPRTAASALVAMVVALALGALFNAPAMKKTALERPFGAERTFRLTLVRPLALTSHWLLLDRPAKLAAAAFGRPDPGDVGRPALVVITPSRPHPGRSNVPPREQPLPKPFKGHPLHLYIAGDSMMGLPGMALTNLSIETRLIKPLLDYHISTGLCRPDFFDWPAQLQRQVKQFDPRAAVLMFGANDNQAVQTASGKIHQFGTAGWKKEYRSRVREVIDLLVRGGVRRVYWVGQPAMPSARYDEQMKLVNGIYESVAAGTIGVHYIDAYALLTNAEGQYAQYLPDAGGEMQQVREQDGEHLTYAGGLRIATGVLKEIRREWLPKRRLGPPRSTSPRPQASQRVTPAEVPTP